MRRVSWILAVLLSVGTSSFCGLQREDAEDPLNKRMDGFQLQHGTILDALARFNISRASVANPITHLKTTGNWSRSGLFAVLRCAFFCALLTATVYSQGQQLEPGSVEELIKKVKQGQFDPGDVHRLAQAGATQAIPALKKQFAVKKDTLLKEAIASALVRLGDKDQIYWDFLTDHARPVVESDAPSPILFDSQGRSVRGQLSPEFVAWAKAHKVDPGDAASAQLYEIPIHFASLARTGDPRGRMLLRKGLLSGNYTIQVVASRGLAKIQDNDSIPLIIEACRKAPSEMAPMIARVLVFFDDPRAQAAAETFIPNKQFLEELRKRSREKGADPFSF